MDSEDRRRLIYRMEDEGFHYCFHDYSDWKEVKDEKFQELLEKYLIATELLKNYIYNS